MITAYNVLLLSKNRARVSALLKEFDAAHTQAPKSEQQILIRWALDMNMSIVVFSTNEMHLKDNLDVNWGPLTRSQLAKVAALPRPDDGTPSPARAGRQGLSIMPTRRNSAHGCTTTSGCSRKTAQVQATGPVEYIRMSSERTMPRRSEAMQ